MPTCQTCGAQVTLLAEVGPNAEGPLPWVEREYTPVSSAKQWELGRCELLVKVLPARPNRYPNPNPNPKPNP